MASDLIAILGQKLLVMITHERFEWIDNLCHEAKEAVFPGRVLRPGHVKQTVSPGLFSLHASEFLLQLLQPSDNRGLRHSGDRS